MAILISKSDTASFTNNEWYRAEAYNPTSRSFTAVTLTTSALAIPVTFLNAGNCMGVILCIRSGRTERAISTMRDVIVDLEENVASVWTVRASKTLTTTQINSGLSPAGSFYVPFEFATPYAVTTAASTWRFTVRSGATNTNHYSLATSNGTAPFYIAWCDTQVTPVSGSDMLVAKNYVDMNSSFTLKSYLGTGETVSGACAISCRNIDPTPANVAYFRCLTPAAPYVLTLDGQFVISSHGGFRLGTESVPIPATNRFKISLENATTGSSVISQFTDQLAQQGVCGRWSFFAYGEVPTNISSTLTGNFLSGVTAITVANGSVFNTNDRLVIGKREGATDAGINRYVVTSVVGNTVNFTPALNTDTAYTGGLVIKVKNQSTNLSGYGVEITRVEGAAKVAFDFALLAGMTANFTCNGVYFQLVRYAGGANGSGYGEDLAYCTPITFKNCMINNNIVERSFATEFSGFILNNTLQQKGIVFENCYFMRCSPMTSITNVSPSPIGTTSYLGGDIYMTNIKIFGMQANNTGWTPISNTRFFIDGLLAENFGGGSSALPFAGYDSTYKNVTIYRAQGDNAYGVIRVIGCINGTFENLKINGANSGIIFESVSNVIFKNTTFGDERANVTDIQAWPKAYTDSVFKTVTGNPIISTKLLAGMAESAQIKFENTNGTNIDYVRQPLGDIYRTGTGLADTTVRTAGGYAMRFQPKSGTVATYWTQNIPTGNIQNQTMTVGVWVKINSANYWAGTHQMPRITVSYDNGTASAYGEAAQSTNWQFVFVPITPTTTFGQMTFTVTGMTDATTSNAYFYVDDFSAALPQGATLNLGNLDLWSNGLPVSPANLATTVTASDVWAADPTTFGTDTVGDKVNKIKNDTGIIPATL